MVEGWDNVLSALMANPDEQEKSRSHYWDLETAKYTVNVDGSIDGLNTMGTVSYKTTPFHKVAHWILLTPFRMMGWRYQGFREVLKLGYVVARKHGRVLTHDMMRQVLTLALIRHHVGLKQDRTCNMIIGDGYGVLTSLFLLAAPERKNIACNLTKSLLLDLLNIRKSSPDIKPVLVRTAEEMEAAIADPSVNLIALQADNAEAAKNAPIGIATNVHSMMEMNPDIIAAYFEILRNNRSAETAFYCSNRIYKKLDDGVITRFFDYPWQDDDQVLMDGVSRWSQWTISRTPPFLHHRTGKKRLTWHRLAVLGRAAG